MSSVYLHSCLLISTSHSMVNTPSIIIGSLRSLSTYLSSSSCFHFLFQLERAPDPFSVVADYFGRRVFNKVTILTEPVKRKAAAPAASTNPFDAPPAIPPRSNNPFESSTNPNNPRSNFESSTKPASTNPFETKSTNPFGEGH